MTNHKSDKALKQGFNEGSETRARKLICTTALISIPIGFPATMLAMNKNNVKYWRAVAKNEIILANL